MARLDPLFKLLKDQGGSDLHLAAGMQPHMRQHGGVKPIGGWPTFSDESLREHLKELANEKQWSHYGTNLDLDFAYALAGVGRFRANYFNQERGAAAVFRIIPEKIRSLEDLKAPAALSALATSAWGSVSNAYARAAPSLSAAIAKTPEPQP
jgi:twitching motility protein PilT